MARLLAASLLVGALSFAPKTALPRRRHAAATAADIEALSARLGDAAVLESMFVIDGAPRQFLRREQFVSSLVEAAGPALGEDAASVLVGVRRVAAARDEEEGGRGFFGNFVAQIAENAGGVKDTREKHQWGTRSRA